MADISSVTPPGGAQPPEPAQPQKDTKKPKLPMTKAEFLDFSTKLFEVLAAAAKMGKGKK